MTSDASNKQIVLVVDGDPMLRGILAEALAGEGLVVLTAAAGEEALAIAGLSSPPPFLEQVGRMLTAVQQG